MIRGDLRMRGNRDSRSSRRVEDETRTATESSSGGPETTSPETLGSAKTIGRYMVLSRIGAGGMGQVYAAYDPKLDRRVALKLLHPSGTSIDRSRLAREAKALARLSHPNVVTVHEVDEQDGRLLIAMEYVQGTTLKEWIHRNPPNETREHLSTALDLLIQAGRGLQEAHSRGLVHRDFKPANVLVGADGRVRVADFGLARVVAGVAAEATRDDEESGTFASSSRDSGRALQQNVTETGHVAGTPAYMAPEQFDGAAADAKVDQFGYCVTAWEVLLGVRPFAKPEDSKGRFGPISRPEGIAVPGRVEEALRKGLAIRPTRRHADLGPLLGALQDAARALEGRVVQPRRRMIMTLMGGLILVGGSVLGGRGLYRARLEAGCVSEGNAIDEVWNDDARASVRQGLAAVGGTFAPTVAEKVTPWIDEHAESWREHATLACMNTKVHERWEPDWLEKAQWCLEDRRLEFEGLVAELADADATFAKEAVQAAAGLSPSVSCVDEGALAGLPELPGAAMRGEAREIRTLLARARTLHTVGEYEAGLEVVRQAETRARALGWIPLRARALALEALLLGKMEALSEAEGACIDAFALAVRSGSWRLAASAANRLAFNVGSMQARGAEGKLWATFASIAVQRGGDLGGLEQAVSLNVLGAIAVSEGRYGDAGSMFEQALRIRERALSGQHPDVVSLLANVAGAYEGQGRLQEAKSANLRVLRLHEATLGEAHPETARARVALARVLVQTGDYTDAKLHFSRAARDLEDALGPEHVGLDDVFEGLGAVYSYEGDTEGAIRLYRRLVEVRERVLRPNHPKVAMSLANLASALQRSGAVEDAQPQYERAVHILEEAVGTEHPSFGGVLGALANNYRLQGKFTEARPLLEQALGLREQTLSPEHPSLAYTLQSLGDVLTNLGEYERGIQHLERSVSIRSAPGLGLDLRGHSRFALAKALWDAPRKQGRDRERALATAAAAVADFEDAGEAFAENAAEVQAWLGERGVAGPVESARK
jgi:tetratricopeptide (TPR) repeat protein